MRIYVVRHGFTLSNQAMTFSEPETRLAPEAPSQLKSVRKYLKQKEFKKVYASDFRRTMDTAHILGYPNPIPEPRMRERNFGIFTGLTHEQCMERYPEEYEKYMEDSEGYRIPGGESFDDLCDRVWDFLDEIAAPELQSDPPIEGFRLRPTDDSAILVVAHFNVVAACLCWVFNNRRLSSHIVCDNGASLLMDVRGSLKTLFIERH